MKKTLLLVLFVYCVQICFGQEKVSEYISYLDHSIPNNFKRVDKTTYMDDLSNIILLTENDIVKVCSVGVAFNYSHEANEWLSFYYNYFEDNKWEYSINSGLEVYLRESVYAIIIKPKKRDDGQIVSLILFTKDFK